MARPSLIRCRLTDGVCCAVEFSAGDPASLRDQMGRAVPRLRDAVLAALLDPTGWYARTGMRCYTALVVAPDGRRVRSPSYGNYWTAPVAELQVRGIAGRDDAWYAPVLLREDGRCAVPCPVRVRLDTPTTREWADWVAAWQAVRASRAWDCAIDATADRVARCLADAPDPVTPPPTPED